MSTRWIHAGCAIALMCGAAACAKDEGAPEPLPAAASVAAERYPLSGIVVAADPARKQITVAHNPIAGYMAAMTMPFNVRDAKAVASAKRGQYIDATLVVDGEHSWLELERDSLRPADKLPPADVASVSAGAHPGDEVPDFALVNQDNSPISMRRFRGKAVALTFIYVQCPLPDFCPLMSKNFAAVERELRNKPDLAGKTQLLSVTIDPKNDTPDVLKAYRATYLSDADSAAPTHWQFATGTEAQVKAITGYFGLTVDIATGQINHSLRTIVIGPDGRVHNVYIGNDWHPADVVADLARAAGSV
jgi:protein SCO1/2